MTPSSIRSNARCAPSLMVAIKKVPSSNQSSQAHSRKADCGNRASTALAAPSKARQKSRCRCIRARAAMEERNCVTLPAFVLPSPQSAENKEKTSFAYALLVMSDKTARQRKIGGVNQKTDDDAMQAKKSRYPIGYRAPCIF